MSLFVSDWTRGFDAKVLDDGPLKLLLRNNAKPERPAQPECWVVHADATISEQYLENTRDEMAEELLAAFEKSVEKAATGGGVARAPMALCCSSGSIRV